MILRPAQEKAMADLRGAYLAGRRAPLLCAHTGFGKSALTKAMLEKTKKSVLYLCHREPLLEMISADLTDAGLRHGVIAGNTAARPGAHNIHLGMMQTVSRRLDRLPHFDWVISDESHLAMSASWSSILQHYSTSFHLGMSATPCRLDGKGLGSHYDEIVYGPSIKKSTAAGYLTPCRVFAPPIDLDVTGAARKSSAETAAALLSTPKITGSAIAEMRKLAPDRQAVVFCSTRKHADAVAEEFQAAGFSAVSIDGADSSERRRAILGDFTARKIQVLVNVDLLTTGWDCPQVSVLIFLRFTESLALYVQMIGRVLRIYPGKVDALIIDHVGNVLRHGMPDADREWTLDGRVKRATAPPVRQCERCYAVFTPAPACPECGHVFQIGAGGARGAAQAVPGELREIVQEDVDARTQHLRDAPLRDLTRAARTRADLIEIGTARGFNPGWADRMVGFKAKARARHAA